MFVLNTEQALHGSDALHGVINVITNPPANIRDSQITLEAGSNSFQRIKATHSNNNGQHAYRININGTHDDGYENNAGFDQQKFNALLHHYQNNNLTISTLLSASSLIQKTAGFVDGQDAYKDKSRKRENPNPEAFRDSHSIRLISAMAKLNSTA